MTIQTKNAFTATQNPTAIINRETFTKVTIALCDVIERKTENPSLASIKFVGEGNYIFASATDLDLELTARIVGAVDHRLETCLLGYQLRDLLKKARKSEYAIIEQVNNDDDAAIARIKFDAVNYDLNSPDINKFPSFPDASNHGLQKFTLSGEKLSMMLTRTMGAISTEETRYYLNGIYMHVVGNTLRMVATDGHRLYMQDVDAPDCVNSEMYGVIIPTKTVKIMNKMIKAKAMPESVSITVIESQIHFEWQSNDGIYYTLQSKTIDGTFPDYNRVIPNYTEICATGGAVGIVGAVNDVSLISNQRGRAVKLSLTNGESFAVVNNPDAGSASAKLPVNLQGDDLEIGFNSIYFTDLIAVADSKEITMNFNDAGSPMVVTGDNEGWKAVLMPMRT